MKTYTDNMERGGIIINITKSGNIKLKKWSAYTDDHDITYYIKPTDEFNADTDWSEIIHDSGTTKAEQLNYLLRQNEIDIVRKVIS